MNLRYLLIVGDSDGRRLRTTASVFSGAEEAKDEFGRLQERLAPGDGWVELASVDDQGHLEQLCRSPLNPPPRRPT